MIRAIIYFIVLFSSLPAYTQFAPRVGVVGSTGISFDSSIIKSWATECKVARGWQNASDTSLGIATAGHDSFALGRATDNPTVSLGDGGYAVVTFPFAINNGQGFDFAVFENAFIDSFLELAFVEVSSDGINYYRFKSICNTDSNIQLNNFGLTDASHIYNLAGKYRLGYGTPFDLEEMKGISGLEINHITHVKIVDVVGSLDPSFGSRDSRGHIINDPWPTPFASSGFDLEAVGVINEYKNIGIADLQSATFEVYPNPVNDLLYLNGKNTNTQVMVTDLFGLCIIINEVNNQIDVSNLNSGLYIITVGSQHLKFLKQ